jgi:hypothetical protein
VKFHWDDVIDIELDVIDADATPEQLTLGPGPEQQRQ